MVTGFETGQKKRRCVSSRQATHFAHRHLCRRLGSVDFYAEITEEKPAHCAKERLMINQKSEIKVIPRAVIPAAKASAVATPMPENKP